MKLRGIKKWTGRIWQVTLAGAHVINASGIGTVIAPVGVVAGLIGAAQVGISIAQHKSTEQGESIEAELARLRFENELLRSAMRSAQMNPNSNVLG
jgi:hypothetical protein